MKGIESWKKDMERSKRNRLRSMQRNHEHVRAIKEAGCSRCGGKFHPAAMDFHHINPEEKDNTIQQLVKIGASIKRIQAEIDKCELVCANCHRVIEYNKREGLV